MLNENVNGFPAGYESDDSGDEWYIDLSVNNKKPCAEISDAHVNGEDKVSRLKRAITAGNVDLVRELMDCGMDVETRLAFDWTPLMCAVHVAHYELAELLLDRGASADFSRDHYTVLMAACTAVSASEEKISKCVALLLSRSADPNICNRSSMTCLMLAARDGYCRVINLLVSHGAQVNFQNDNGHTALIMAVQYGRAAAVLKLLQLGADKFIKTKTGKTASDMAKVFNYPEISRILDSPDLSAINGSATSRAEALQLFLSRNPDLSYKESISKLSDLELLLHGLSLGHLTDIVVQHGITWSDLLMMEERDLDMIGITDPEDQKKLLSTMKQMQLDIIDLDALTPPTNVDSSSEDFLNFLISLKRQCCYLTETLQDVISRFPRSSSEVVLSCDPKKKAQALCTELVTQTGDLQKEIVCLKTLFSKMDHTEFTFQPLQPKSSTGFRRKTCRKLAMVFGLGLFGAGIVVVALQSKY